MNGTVQTIASNLVWSGPTSDLVLCLKMTSKIAPFDSSLICLTAFDAAAPEDAAASFNDAAVVTVAVVVFVVLVDDIAADRVVERLVAAVVAVVAFASAADCGVDVTTVVAGLVVDDVARTEGDEVVEDGFKDKRPFVEVVDAEAAGELFADEDVPTKLAVKDSDGPTGAFAM